MCEGRRPQPAKFTLQCPLVRIYDQAEAAAIKKLKRARLYRGRGWFEALKDDYMRISKKLEIAEGKIEADWPVRIAWLAEAILDARIGVEAAELKVS